MSYSFDGMVTSIKTAVSDIAYLTKPIAEQEKKRTMIIVAGVVIGLGIILFMKGK